MRPVAKYVLRFSALLILAAALSVLFAPPVLTSGPYLSALQDLTMGSDALASRTCLNEMCAFCGHNKNTNCHRKGTLCTTVACT